MGNVKSPLLVAACAFGALGPIYLARLAAVVWRKRNLLMPSFLIRNSRVEAGMPIFLAAPLGPEIFPREIFNAFSIAVRSSCESSSAF
jgi:hypothetical protein